ERARPLHVHGAEQLDRPGYPGRGGEAGRRYLRAAPWDPPVLLWRHRVLRECGAGHQSTAWIPRRPDARRPGDAPGSLDDPPAGPAGSEPEGLERWPAGVLAPAGCAPQTAKGPPGCRSGIVRVAERSYIRRARTRPVVRGALLFRCGWTALVERNVRWMAFAWVGVMRFPA